jgi:uncharacterized protein YecT (DUF1311 family)
MRLALSLVLLTSAIAHAAKPLESCVDTAKNTPELTACYGQESERQDKRLKDAMDEEVRKWTFSREFESDGWSKEQLAGLRRSLRQSQIEWNKYRNTWCHYRADTMNGSGSAIAFPQCMIEMTKQRLAEMASS